MFREMRRKDRLESKEMGIELLNKSEYGVLSVLGDDDYPYGVPIHFAYKDDRVYIHSFLTGHKIDAIKKHPKVCLTVVGETEVMKDQIATNFTSVVVFGKAEVVPPPANGERDTTWAALIDKYIPNDEAHTSKYIKEEEDNTNAIIIKVEHITCKHRNIR